MPQLIKGQMRFTDEDHEMTEFNEKVQIFVIIKQDTLYALLKEELDLSTTFERTRNNRKI
jgi:hypothetical protein